MHKKCAFFERKIYAKTLKNKDNINEKSKKSNQKGVAICNAFYVNNQIFETIDSIQKLFYATAVLLTINAPFLAKSNGTQIAVAFFEIGAEIIYAEFLRNGCSYLVDRRRVFMRAYGKGGGKKVVFAAMSEHIFCRVFKTQIEAKRASCAAFEVVFMSFDERYIFVLRLLRHYEFYILIMRNHVFKCVFALDKLLFRQNVGIVVIHRNVKVRRQILKHAACARAATRVQKQARLDFFLAF